MILLLTIFFPIMGIIFISFVSSERGILIKQIALFFSSLSFFFSLFLLFFFDKSSLFFHYIVYFDWFSFLNVNFLLGLDGISLFFVLLTTFLIPLCILAGWKNISTHIKEFFILFLFLEFLLLLIFSVLDLLLFYIFFESVLIPMFLIIGIWGSRARKIKASYFLFIYTLFGSLLMLFGILLILFEVGTTNLLILMPYKFSFERQLLLWLLFFASFSVKIPIVPFHIWLPEAHVEAPTLGSVILAGVLLKLGTYGLLRFSFVLFADANSYFTILVYVISIVSIVYSSLTTLRQVDLKRIVAYSSVAHMNFSLLGLFSQTIQGIEGGILLMLSHGFVASSLFLCIGIVYDRHHTRLVKYYSGFVSIMPIFAIIFFFFSVSNLGLPGTSSFIGELLIMVGSFYQNSFPTFVGSLCIFLGSIYTILVYARICFGNLKNKKSDEYLDISFREFIVLFPLVFMTLFAGFCPNVFLEYIYFSTSFLNIVYI